jgi:hypothetical protein
MSSPNVLVTVEGLAGTPKHVIADAIAAETPLAAFSDDPGAETYLFDRAPRISAGDYYRAAARLAIQSENTKTPINRFTSWHSDRIREQLEAPETAGILYTDTKIEEKVSDISSRIPGVQALCSSMFVKDVSAAYHRDGRNLVIADALDPMGHLQAARILGEGPSRIPANRILPIYVDTTPLGAGRLNAGNTYVVADRSNRRRRTDAIRPEKRVLGPSEDDRLDDITEWESQFNLDTPHPGPALALRFDYHPGTDSETISQFAREIVQVAQSVSARSEPANRR